MERAPLPSKETSLDEPPALPKNIAGWISRELPLGGTESVAGKARAVLNFNRYVYREYKRENRWISVYVAYWRPGQMPPHLVASHTPDQCWTSAGWKCDSFGRRSVKPGGLRDKLKPAEWRVFRSPGGSSVHVLYWHVVGTNLYDYGGQRFNSVPHVGAWMRGAWDHFRGRQAEQYFIRLTSNRPVEEVWNEPGFQQILAALAKLGLAEPRS